MTAEAPTRSEVTCPVCGADAQRGQLVCLECGSRITLAYRRPPSWKVPVAITAFVVLLAAVGGFFAYQALDEEAEREAESAPAQPREGAADGRTEAGEGTTADVDEDDTGTAADDEQPTGDDATAPGDDAQPDGSEEPDDQGSPDESGSADATGLTRRDGLYAWPRDLRAFTVVLLSTEDRASATRFARSAGGSPDNQIGVIRSDDFASLPQGFFIVFSGAYQARNAAERAAARLGGRFPGAFAQLVRR